MDQSSERGSNDQRKRRRTSIEPNLPEDDHESCQRDPDFYFPDGTICIRASNILFKVYQGSLARHSQVFASLFSLPPPASPEKDPQEMFDGVHLVRLLDEPDDIRALLSLMQNAPPDDVSFTALAGIIRITHKYQLDQYLTWAVKQLKRSYPTCDLPMEDVYKHPSWSLYAKPDFLFEMIALTTLLDQPDLGSMTGLAYYALTLHSWTAQDMVAKSFAELSGALLMTVLRGQQRTRKQHGNDIRILSQHKCHDETCKWKLEAVGSLGSAMAGDFILQLLEVSKNLQNHPICRLCRPLLPGLEMAARQKFKLMPRYLEEREG